MDSTLDSARRSKSEPKYIICISYICLYTERQTEGQKQTGCTGGREEDPRPERLGGWARDYITCSIPHDTFMLGYLVIVISQGMSHITSKTEFTLF